jgi:hypothetical protein
VARSRAHVVEHRSASLNTSDQHVSPAKATYKQRITHFTEELTFLSEQDKDWIMGRAILARLGWT